MDVNTKVFKFQMIMSGNRKWTANLFIEDERIGIIGLDEGGIFVRTAEPFTIKETTILIEQINDNFPGLANERIEFLKFN